jgi:hypothetical protein
VKFRQPFCGGLARGGGGISLIPQHSDGPEGLSNVHHQWNHHWHYCLFLRNIHSCCRSKVSTVFQCRSRNHSATPSSLVHSHMAAAYCWALNHSQLSIGKRQQAHPNEFVPFGTDLEWHWLVTVGARLQPHYSILELSRATRNASLVGLPCSAPMLGR